MGKITDFVEDKKTQIINYFDEKKKIKEASREYKQAKNAGIENKEIYHRTEKDGTNVTTILSQSGSLEVGSFIGKDGFKVTTINGIVPNRDGSDHFASITRMEDPSGRISYSGYSYSNLDGFEGVSEYNASTSDFADNDDQKKSDYFLAHYAFCGALEAATDLAPGLGVLRPVDAPARLDLTDDDLPEA